MKTGAFARVGVAVGLAAILLGGCYIHTDAFKAKVSRSEDLTAPLTDITGISGYLDIWGHHTQFKTEISKVSPEFPLETRPGTRAW